MDHQRRQRQASSPRGNASAPSSGGAPSGKHKGGGGGKGGGKKPIKVVYISNPMRVKTSAAEFRSLVQELTGRNADPSKYNPEDFGGVGAVPGAAAASDIDGGGAQVFSPGDAAASSDTTVVASSTSATAEDHRLDAAAGAPHGGDYYDDGYEDIDGFRSQLLENNYAMFSPPALLYDHHPHSKFPFD